MTVPVEVIAALSSAERPVLAAHVNPDIDALGAMLALARAMPAAGPAIVLPDAPLSAKARFMLDLAGNVAVADADRLAAADVVAVVDTAGTNRVNVAGGWDAIAGKRIVNIDHHVTNSDFGQLNWVVGNASSTCEMIHRLIRAAGWPVDGAGASLLFAGIYADTAGFSLPNTSAETFETAAALARAGADIERIAARLYRSQAPNEFDLIRTVYHNTRLAGGGRIAYSTLTHDEITAAGCTPQDIDDQVSIPRSLSGIRMAILFSEGDRGVIRINLRGENDTAVLPLARKLGGGGHTHSAGVRMRGELPAVVQRVLDEAATSLALPPSSDQA